MYRNGCENRACPTQRQASLSTAGVWLVFACLKQTKCTPGKNKSSFDFALASPIFASGSKDKILFLIYRFFQSVHCYL